MRTIALVAGLMIALVLPATAAARAGMTPTLTTVNLIPNSLVAGQDTTLTVTVVPAQNATGTPTGTVQVSKDGVPMGGALTLQDGKASMPTWEFAGTYRLGAV